MLKNVASKLQLILEKLEIMDKKMEDVIEKVESLEKAMIVYADLPKEIQENRKKKWPCLKKAREEGKSAYFSRKEPNKFYVKGRFVAP